MAGADVIQLAAGDYRLVLEPARGGSIARFDWRGKAVMRPTGGTSILDTACFPLVPFSNRIAQGRFKVDGRAVKLAPNMPGSDHPHPLHGFGWLEPWHVVEQSAGRAVLRHTHEAGAWPWDYAAGQVFELNADGLRHQLTLTNLSDTPMPAGLGVHPYFPCSAETRYIGHHRGEWQVSADCLPLSLDERDTAIDWWAGQPVASRTVDTVYTGREGALAIDWPERDLTLTILPTQELGFTVVYTPADADYFCVEPVSHATDAINSADGRSGMRWLAPGDGMAAAVHYRAGPIIARREGRC